MTRALIGALILSLVIWVTFYYLGWPLMASETAVVTGLCLLVALGAELLVRRFRGRTPRSKRKESQPAKKEKHSRIAKGLIFILVGCATLTSAASEVHLCTIDKPTAEPTDRVRLSVLSTPGDSKSENYRWSVPVGRIEGVGSDTNWLLTNSPAGKYIATLSMVRGDSQDAICSVHLYVIEPVRGTTSRGLLVPGKRAPPGFGLYTYLLFSSPPDASSRDRYMKAIETYLRLSPSLEQMEDVVDKREINLNCVPVNSSPLGDVDPEWILRHYDYARARGFLTAMSGTYFEGPYLLSASRQAADGESLSRPLLFQDLSLVPPHLVAAWYEHFLNEAAQRDFSTATSVGDLALRARTLIAVLAIALPDVQTELDRWIQFAR
jgi:hypothetical protein